MAIGAMEVSRIICPSGLARTTSDVPMVPVAPPTLRMTTCVPIASVNTGWIRRPIMSVPPPAGQGMIICTCAEAGAVDAIRPQRARAARDRNFIAVFPSLDGAICA
jgi:hypothetical protein